MLSVPAQSTKLAEGAPRHVETLTDDAVDIMLRPYASEKIRNQKLRALLKEGFGIRLMSRRVLGDYWESATKEQRRQFRDAFRRYFFNYLIGLLRENEPDDFEVTDAIEIDEQDTRVTTSIERYGIPFAEVDWVVREIDEEYQVVDVLLDRTSLLRTYRSEFRSLARMQGLDALIEVLEQKAKRRR